MNGKQEKGLSDGEAGKLLQKYGLNEIKEVNRVSALMMLYRQIKNNFVIYLLVFATILSFAVEKSVTGYTLLAIILTVICVGFIQEYRAESAIQSLRRMITPVSIVIRNGKYNEINSNEIVPGDFLVLRSGERIPADADIVECSELRVNESMLTGESAEVAKSSSGGKDNGRLFMGTYIVNGKSIARVMNTGMTTRFGAIAGLISREEKELPLQKKVNEIAKYMILIGLFAALITGFIYFLRGSEYTSEFFIEVLLITIAFAVSAFPESFPVVLITTLSAGAYRMAKKNAIVNRMSVIETLGEATVICSDKTGTITTGEMTVKKIFVDGEDIEVEGAGYRGEGNFIVNSKKIEVKGSKVLEMLCKAGVICNDSSINRTGEDMVFEAIGSSTEAALLVMAAKGGLFKEDLKFEVKEEMPFNSERKMMSVSVKIDNKNYIFMKGAPERVLEACAYMQKSSGKYTITKANRRQLLEVNERYTDKAYRTLALAYREGGNLSDENKMIFLGFVAMEDPPREDIKETLEICRRSGIAVKMITGDHPNTALSIARQIGLEGLIITGADLDNLSDDELKFKIREIVIFARVRPEHKLRIVNALKDLGEVVAMTGDGVNDAPALKASHIGVAMGKNGTDVSRSVADITLKDDHFSTIVSAIREGRTIFLNMRKFVTYQLSCNIAEIIILFLGVLLGLPIPLLAIQILFMNMVTDDLPAITLGLNPSSNDVMDRRPRKKPGILGKEHIQMLLIAGLIMGIGTLGVYIYSLYVLEADVGIARTTALVTLIFFEVANAFNFRSFRKGTLLRSPFVNRPLVYASVLSLLATLAIIYTSLNRFFETSPLGLKSWTIALIPCLFLLVIFDIIKVFNNKKNFWKDIN